jgi:hypothetical protein
MTKAQIIKAVKSGTANRGVEGARHLADLVMKRYFERLEVEQHTET